ncbi:DUF4172 domain-containing protein [Thiolapillus sp.]|uniref:DUF4172 domain-containing protein n=1 Tax=Thiolapillus sp. TaxID=2017437 RepID=UPI003AF459D7
MADFSAAASRLAGRVEALADVSRQEITVDLMVSEAVKTMEIEGERLDRESVVNSIAALMGFVRCQPWRAKRRLVVPSSREAALFSRRALRQRENKVGLRTRRPVIWEPSTEQQRACEVVA